MITGEDSTGQLYDEQADEFARFANESYTWNFIEKPAFDRYIPDLYKPDTRVLDVGCGTGRVMNHLVSKGVAPQNIKGFDSSQKMVEKAQASQPLSTVFQASLTDFDLPPGSVDLVTSNMVFQYLDNKDLRLALDKIYDVLTKDGILFFVMPHYLHNFKDRITEESFWEMDG